MRARLGVIGAGYWGSNLIRNARELDVLAAVCDVDPLKRAQVQADDPHLRVVATAEELFTCDIDGVIIAAPAALHERLAIASIAAGKHVFIEKPLALTIDGGRRIVEAARACGVMSFVGHLLLYHSGVQRLLAEIGDGCIGDVVHLRSRRLALGRLRFEENAWWSLAPHDIALMLTIFGGDPVDATSTQIGWVTPDICDFAYADYVFAGGRSAHIEVGWLDPMKAARLDVFGTRGVLTFEDARAGARLLLSPCGARSSKDGRHEIWRDAPVELAVARDEPLRGELEAFLECISSGIEASTNGEQGLQVLRALELAEHSARRVRHSALRPAFA